MAANLEPVGYFQPTRFIMTSTFLFLTRFERPITFFHSTVKSLRARQDFNSATKREIIQPGAVIENICLNVSAHFLSRGLCQSLFSSVDPIL